MTNRVALVFHMNLDHANLTRGESLELIESGLEEMLREIKVPINISSTARDWELLNELNPSLVNWVKENPLIAVLDGTYSHAIPSHFPGFVKAQFEFGHEVHEKIFGGNAGASLSAYGFVPEFAFDSGMLPTIRGCWIGNIASSTTSQMVKKGHENRNPPRCLYSGPDAVIVHSSDGTALAVNIARRDKLNKNLNRFFRGSNEPVHFTERLRRKASDSDAPFIIYLNDFETPLINKAYYQGRLLQRKDMWGLLMQHLPDSGIDFILLDLEAFTNSQYHAEKIGEGYVIAPRRTDKWVADAQAQEIYLAISCISERVDMGSRYQVKSILTAMSSDAFVKPSNSSVMRGRLYDGKIKRYRAIDSVFSEVDAARRMEVLHSVNCLRIGVPVNYGIGEMPKAQQEYFNALHSIFSK